MIQKTIDDIERGLRDITSISDENRTQLLKLLADLKSEMEQLSPTHEEQAQSISHFARASAHEATRTQKNPHLLKLSLEGLVSSAKGFEGSHPKLVQTVNKISYLLSNMGI